MDSQRTDENESKTCGPAKIIAPVIYRIGPVVHVPVHAQMMKRAKEVEWGPEQSKSGH